MDGGGKVDPVEDQPSIRQELVRWSESLAAIARTGLGFTQNLYERERFEEVLKVAADIAVASGARTDSASVLDGWLEGIGSGVAGYVTPKVAVGAVVGNEKNEILLVRRADSGAWLYPTGWADVGYSASEVVVKEVKEETGIDVAPVRVIAVLDGLRLGFNRIPLYSVVFQCRALGGELLPHPLECSEVGWFAHDALPLPMIGASHWVAHAFAALRNEAIEVMFDPPRTSPWRTQA